MLALLERGAATKIVNNKGQSVRALARSHLKPETYAAIVAAEEKDTREWINWRLTKSDGLTYGDLDARFLERPLEPFEPPPLRLVQRRAQREVVLRQLPRQVVLRLVVARLGLGRLVRAALTRRDAPLLPRHLLAPLDLRRPRRHLAGERGEASPLVLLLLQPSLPELLALGCALRRVPDRLFDRL